MLSAKVAKLFIEEIFEPKKFQPLPKILELIIFPLSGNSCSKRAFKNLLKEAGKREKLRDVTVITYKRKGGSL